MTNDSLQKDIIKITNKIEREPDNDVYYSGRAGVYYKLQKYEEAIRDFSKAIEIKPDNNIYYLGRASGYFKLQKYEEAIQDYSKAIEIKPDNAVYYLGRAGGYFKLQKYEEVIQDYSKAIEIKPNDAEYYYIRARLYAKLKQYIKAIQDYSKAIEIKPTNDVYYSRRAGLYCKLRKYDEAIQDYSKAIEIKPDNAGYYLGRASVYSKLQKYEEFIRDISKAIEIKPNNAGYYSGRAGAYYMLHKYEESIQDLSKAIEIKPNNANYYYVRANGYNKLQKYEEAIQDYSKAIEIKPNEYIYYYLRAQINFVLQNYYNVLEDTEKVLTLSKSSGELFGEVIVRDTFILQSFIKIKQKSKLGALKILKKYSNDLNKPVSKELKRHYFSEKEKKIKNLFIQSEKKLFNVSKLFLDKDCDVKFMGEAFVILFQLNKRNGSIKNYLKKAEEIDWFLTYDEMVSKKEFEKHNTRKVYLDYKNYQEWIEKRNSLGKDLFLIKRKILLIQSFNKIIIKEFTKGEKKGDIDELFNFYYQVSNELQNEYENLVNKKEKEKAQVKIEERDRIIRNQAHNIKNILRSIINPLKYLQRIIHNPQIEEALKHAEIIREMVNATSLSYSGLKEDFIFDAENNDKGISLKEMIITSVESSVGNILEDIDYYSNFWEQYFPDDNIYNEALEEYRNLHEIPEKERFKYLIKFINKYMSKLDIKFRDSERFVLGNKKSSGVKMLALFNDLISNAIKYTSFVPKDERFISIQFFSNEELITLKVENSYLENTQAETTGIGNLIIDNMIGVMEGKVSRNITENNNFIIEIKFSNFWKGAINE